MYHWLNDDDIPPLAESVLAILEQVGILCQNNKMLQALDAAGAKVDYASERVHFPQAMASEYVQSFRQAGDTDTAARHPDRFVAPELPDLGTQVAPLFFDYEKQEHRRGNAQDFISLLKLGEVLHGEAGVGHALVLTEVPPLVEPLESALLLAEYAHKPGPAFAWNVRQIEYLIEMGEILGLEDWFTPGSICFAHPFRFDRDVADRFVYTVERGWSVGLTAMPVAGLTTPVTIEGFIAVASAEHIATWVAARALNSDVPLGGSMWAGTVDMKTGQVSYSCYDAMRYAFATVEFLRRWCGLTIPVGGGEYCDAKAPGMYTALEKAYKAMTIAAFTGCHPGIGQGMLDEGKMISPLQLLLERELSTGLQTFAGPIRPTAERIGLPSIVEVGIGSSTNHLEVAHTMRHFRSCLWLPQLIERAGWDGFENEAQLLDKVQRKVETLIMEYSKPPGREEKLAAMRAVVKRATERLLQ